MPRRVDININLLPPKNRVQFSKTWSAVLILLILMASLFGYLLILQSRDMKSQQAENIRLKTAIKSEENEINAYQPMQIMEQEIFCKYKEFEVLEKTKVSYVAVLNELDRVKPSPIIIVGAEVKPPQVIVTGFSPNHSNVSRMLEAIKTSPIFTNVAELSSEMNGNTNEVKFTLQIEWGAVSK